MILKKWSKWKTEKCSKKVRTTLAMTMERKQKEFFIYVVLRAGKFFKVFFCRKNIVVVLRDYPYRDVIKLLLRSSICPGKIIFLVELFISFMTCDELHGVQDGLVTF